MPRGFTEKERESIHQQLLERGREIFATYGVRKTSVEDLTRAVGISKGAFYIFFSSKEELLMEILEQFEARFRDKITSCLEQTGKTPRERLAAVLKSAFITWRDDPITRRFSQEDYQYLLRKLPEERVRTHLQSDDEFVFQVLAYLKSQGAEIQADPAVAAGLMKALFYVSLHGEEIGKDIYPKTIDTLIELVSGHVIKE